MREDQFRLWMERQRKYQTNTMNTYLVGLRAVEQRYRVDLDKEYQGNLLETLIFRIRRERGRTETGGNEYRALSGDITKLNAYGKYRQDGGTKRPR